MRTFVASLLLMIVAIPALAMPPTKTELESLVMERMDVLARVYKISWDAAPAVQIGFPTRPQNLAELVQSATYYSKPSAIWYNPLPYRPERELGDLELNALDLMRRIGFDASKTTDHELGHAYFFNELSRLTKQTRPYFSGPDSLGQKLGFDTLVEGLGDVIEKRVPPPATPDAWWRTDLNLQSEDVVGSKEWQRLTYQGGYRLMGPLVEAYSLPTVVDYAVGHPLVIHGNQVPESVKRWRRQAEKDLRAQARK